jgi:hypothetical protein
MLGIISVAMILATSACSTTSTAKPGVVVAEVKEMSANVEAVDYSKRLVTLKGPDGNTVVVKAGPEVRNLDQVKPGDQLVVRLYDSVAVFVRKSSEPPQATQLGAVEVAAKGEKPAGVVMETTEFTAKVEAIDYGKRTVTLKNAAGVARTLAVDPSVQRFQDVKKGDEVVIRHTEALAIAVQKP